MSGEKLGRQEAGQEQVRSAKQGQGSVPGTGRGMLRTRVHSRVKGGVTAGRAEGTAAWQLLGMDVLYIACCRRLSGAGCRLPAQGRGRPAGQGAEGSGPAADESTAQKPLPEPRKHLGRQASRPGPRCVSPAHPMRPRPAPTLSPTFRSCCCRSEDRAEKKVACGAAAAAREHSEWKHPQAARSLPAAHMHPAARGHHPRH